MAQSRRSGPQHEEPSPARPRSSPGHFRGADRVTACWAVRARWWRGRWRSWQAVIRLLPVAGPVTAAAVALNLVTGLLPLGFAAGTSVAIGRAAGAGRVPWGGVLAPALLAVAALLLQAVLSPFQAAFTELISRRVDGACARQAHAGRPC